jgi:hypothetical protein|tara:strand:- start:145 stop:732 length:588 start_codon:yes stop_codon:yes gene_type:complete
MPAFTFDKILEKGAALGKLPAKERKSRDWFRNQARRTSITPRKLQSEAKSQAVNRVSVGKMYFFAYDPKTKKELPYYDRFPLIFPFKKLSDGFMGINLHYLPPRLRAKLMDALYGLVNNKRYDETTRLNLSYRVLNGASRYRFFKPTVKRYLSEKVKSRFIEVNAEQWDMALFLPVEQFSKASKSKVWSDSRNGI